MLVDATDGVYLDVYTGRLMPCVCALVSPPIMLLLISWPVRVEALRGITLFRLG